MTSESLLHFFRHDEDGKDDWRAAAGTHTPGAPCDVGHLHEHSKGAAARAYIRSDTSCVCAACSLHVPARWYGNTDNWSHLTALQGGIDFPSSSWLSAVGSAINNQVDGSSSSHAKRLLMPMFANMSTRIVIISCLIFGLIKHELHSHKI